MNITKTLMLKSKQDLGEIFPAGLLDVVACNDYRTYMECSKDLEFWRKKLKLKINRSSKNAICKALSLSFRNLTSEEVVDYLVLRLIAVSVNIDVLSIKYYRRLSDKLHYGV
jgi:hypothetical protein